MTNAKFEAWLSGEHNRETDRLKVQRYMQHHITATTDEVSRHIGKNINTAAARINELEQAGAVVSDGQKNGYSKWIYVSIPSNRQRLAEIYRIERLRNHIEKVRDKPGVSTAFKNACDMELNRLIPGQ